MRTVQLKVSDTDFQKYNLGDGTEIKFSDLIKSNYSPIQ